MVAQMPGQSLLFPVLIDELIANLQARGCADAQRLTSEGPLGRVQRMFLGVTRNGRHLRKESFRREGPEVENYFAST